MDGPGRNRCKTLLELLDDVQRTLFERAVAFRDEHTQQAETYDALKQTLEGRPGFVLARWCGSAACEAQIKTDTQATIRNIPLDGPPAPSGTCVRLRQAGAACGSLVREKLLKGRTGWPGRR